MAKRRKTQVRKGAGRRKVKRAGSRSYALIIAAVAVVAVVIVALVALGQGSASSSLAPGQVSMDKSKGAADAPVVVVEYGDFQ
jgi:hypothetical protein